VGWRERGGGFVDGCVLGRVWSRAEEVGFWN